RPGLDAVPLSNKGRWPTCMACRAISDNTLARIPSLCLFRTVERRPEISPSLLVVGGVKCSPVSHIDQEADRAIEIGFDRVAGTAVESPVAQRAHTVSRCALSR